MFCHGAEEVNDSSGHTGYATAPDGDDTSSPSATVAAPSGPAVDLLGGDFVSSPATDSAENASAGARAGAVSDDDESIVDMLGVGDDSGGGGGAGARGGVGGGVGLDEFLRIGIGPAAAEEGSSGKNGESCFRSFFEGLMRQTENE